MKRWIHGTSVLMAAFGLSLPLACGDDDSETPGIDAGNDDAGNDDAGDDRDVSDGDSVAILLAINEGEVEQAQAAIGKLQHGDVRDFATEMLEDHGKARMDLQALALEEEIAVTENSVSRELRAESDRVVTRINTSLPSQVDRTYIDAQVVGHTKALTLIRDGLIEDAEDEELRAFLNTAESVVEKHLEVAKALQNLLEVVDAGVLDGGTGIDAGDAALDLDGGPADAGDAALDAAALDASDADATVVIPLP